MSMPINISRPTTIEYIKGLQQGCRPRGMIQNALDLTSRGNATDLSHQEVAKSFFTKEELKCIAFQLGRALGHPPDFTTRQKEIEKKIQVLYQRIGHFQLNPLKLLAADIMNHLLETRDMCREFKSAYAYDMQGKMSLEELIETILRDFFIHFSSFNEYFREGDQKYYTDFKAFLQDTFLPSLRSMNENIIAIGERYIGKTERKIESKLNPLIEKGNLLLECLNDPKNLFPLLLTPQTTQLKDKCLPSQGNLAFLKKLSKVLIFGIEEGIKKCNELSKDLNSYPMDSELKSFIGNLYPHSDLQLLLELVKDFRAASCITRLAKIADFQGNAAFTPQRQQECFEVLNELILKGKAIADQYTTTLSIVNKQGLRIKEASKNQSQKLQKKLAIILQTVKFFDIWIADPMFPFQLMSVRLYDTCLETFKAYDQIDKKLVFLLPEKTSSIKSYYLRNFDLFSQGLTLNILSLYSFAKTDQSRGWIESLLFSIGGIKESLKELTIISYLSFFSAQTKSELKLQSVFHKISVLRNNELNKLKEEFKKSEQELRILKSIEESLTALQNALIPNFMQGVAKINHQADFYLTLYPMQVFLMKRLGGRTEFDSTLLDHFNTQLEITKTIAKGLDFSGFQKLKRALATIDYTKEENEQFKFYVESYLNNLLLIEELLSDHSQIENLQGEEASLSLFKKLLSYEERSINFEEIKAYYSNITDDLETLCRRSNPDLANLTADLQLIYISRFTEKYIELFFVFQLYFLGNHSALLEWGREETLSSKRDIHKVKKQASTPRTKGSSTETAPKKKERVKEINPPIALPLHEITDELTPFQELDEYYQECLFHIMELKKRSFSIIWEGEAELCSIRNKQMTESLDLLENTYLPLIQEQLASPLREKTPYLFNETLLLNGTLALEQTLKFRIASRTPSRLKECEKSHDLVKLALLAELELSTEEMLFFCDARDIPSITSRHPWSRKGTIAKMLRTCVNSPDSTTGVESMLIPLLQRVCTELQKETNQTFTKNHRLIKSPLPLDEKIGEPNMNSIQKVQEYSLEIQEKVSRLKTIHFASLWGRLCIGNTTENHSIIRERQILNFVKNTPFYIKGIEEVTPYFFLSTPNYSQTNFFFEKLTLLLEQSFLATIAYLDIPSEQDPSRHILSDKIGSEYWERPRYFDHNVERAMNVLESFLPSDQFSLPHSQKASVIKLRSFLSHEARYLTSHKKGGLSTEMLTLRQMVKDLYLLQDGFLTIIQRKDFHSRYGSEESKWISIHLDEMQKYTHRVFYPIIFDVLEVTNHLLTLSLNQRI